MNTPKFKAKEQLFQLLQIYNPKREWKHSFP